MGPYVSNIVSFVGFTIKVDLLLWMSSKNKQRSGGIFRFDGDNVDCVLCLGVLLMYVLRGVYLRPSVGIIVSCFSGLCGLMTIELLEHHMGWHNIS